MDSTNPTECGMCNAGFNDDSRCPRSLPCSHNLCTECIEYLITKDNRHCPFCGHEFKSTSSADFMINRALLECISSLPVLRRQYTRQASKKSTVYQQRIADFKKDVCTANELISSDLKELEKDVERIMRVEEEFQEGYNRQKSEFCHRVLDQIKEYQANMDGHFESSRTCSLRLQKLRQELKKREEKLAAAKRTLDSTSSLEEMASLMDKTEEVNTAASGWVESVREDLLEKETQIQERKKALKASEKMQISLTKALTSKPKEDILHPVPITGASASKMDLSSQVTVCICILYSQSQFSYFFCISTRFIIFVRVMYGKVYFTIISLRFIISVRVIAMRGIPYENLSD
ncbi:E3 ubiquitin-protein ligase RNF168-like [Macrobrachium nipponense]|uniref:E3 ubiquitin-protein ligase RNF168-like n=1 Tax=Macrobrachium nipponense TaxID=159736 RepID=UPI0030C7DC5A